MEVDVQFDRVAASAKEITLETFATDESASVQVRPCHPRRLFGFARSFVCRGSCTPPCLHVGHLLCSVKKAEAFRVANFLFGCGPNHRLAFVFPILLGLRRRAGRRLSE